MPTATTKLKNTLRSAISNLGIVTAGKRARTVRKPGKSPRTNSPRSFLSNESTGSELFDATKAVSAAGIAIPA